MVWKDPIAEPPDENIDVLVYTDASSAIMENTLNIVNIRNTSIFFMYLPP